MQLLRCVVPKVLDDGDVAGQSSDLGAENAIGGHRRHVHVDALKALCPDRPRPQPGRCHKPQLDRGAQAIRFECAIEHEHDGDPGRRQELHLQAHAAHVSVADDLGVRRALALGSCNIPAGDSLNVGSLAPSRTETWPRTQRPHGPTHWGVMIVAVEHDSKVPATRPTGRS